MTAFAGLFVPTLRSVNAELRSSHSRLCSSKDIPISPTRKIFCVVRLRGCGRFFGVPLFDTPANPCRSAREYNNGKVSKLSIVNEDGAAAAKQGKEKYWFSALNPLIYSAAIVPSSVGAAAAFYELRKLGMASKFSLSSALLVMLGEVMLQAWLNTSNDVYDSETGVDKNKHDSFVNLTGAPGKVQAVALLCLAVGFVCVYVANIRLANNGLMKLAVAGVAFGYAYQGPPFRFSYRGWGEPMTFTAFGPLSTLAASHAQLGTFSSLAFFASLLVGFMVTSIIFAHHFPSYIDDRDHKKMTPVASLGPLKASQVYPWAVVYPCFVTAGILLVTKLLPWQVPVGVMLTIPYARKLLDQINAFVSGQTKSSPTKYAVLWHLAGGILMTIGFLLAR